jgi:mono/diheme cytochrome c family protein
MRNLARCGWFFVGIAVLAAGYVLGHLPSTRVPLIRPVSARVPLASHVVFAAGVGGRGRGTTGSTYQSQCASCHGSNGKGDGWTAWLFRLQMRNLRDAAYMRTLSDDYLFQIIKQGGANLGKPGMPSWGQDLTDREIRDLVVYIRSLTLPPPPRPTGAER